MSSVNSIKIALHHRMADSINLSFDMDATWKKSRISIHQPIRNSISLLLVVKKPSVRFKFTLSTT